MKRLFDFAMSAFGLLVSIPIIFVAAIMIRLESPGSPIFAQTRVGRDEKPFTCYKLRTMYKDTAWAPTHEAKKSSVTPLGAKLRRWKLDELPQLWNVLTGHMSLVGPRPCLVSQHELIAARRRQGVFTVAPGITGLAQVQNVDMSDPERLAKIDAEYVRTVNLFTDIKLIFATIFGRGVGVDHVA